MPIYKLTGSEAVKQRKGNPFAGWPSREMVPNRVEPVALPHFAAQFSLEPNSSIFTMGSCFAREIEVRLQERGFSIPVLDHIGRFRTSEVPGLGQLVDRSILNQYGAPSVFNQMNWAFKTAIDELVPDVYAHEIFPGKFIDLDLPATIKPGPLEHVVNRKRALTACTASLKGCDALIITLGLSELWWDNAARCYRNRTILPRIIEHDPSRFELHVLSYAEILKYTNDALDIVFGVRPGIKVLLTVSPVPLSATYTDADVMIANTYSKAVLRAATEEIVRTRRDVFYFPSYETVVLSERHIAWEKDMVHVQPNLVKKITTRMMNEYSAQISLDATEDRIDAVLSGLLSVSSRSSAEIFKYIWDNIAIVKANAELACRAIEQFLRFSNVEDANTLLDETKALISEFDHAFFKCQIQCLEKEFPLALQTSGLLDRKHPKFRTGAMYRLLANVYSKMNMMDELLRVVNDWTALWPTRAEPYMVLANVYARNDDVGGAIKAFESALAREFEATDVLLPYITFLVSIGRVKEAKEQMAKVRPTTYAQRVECERLGVLLATSIGGE